jgi:aryl carrier-like protein
MITGVGFPLPQDGSELAREPRFSYLFNSRGGSKIGGMDDGEGSDQADQAIKQFRMMHKSGADKAALCNACIEVVSAQFVKILRLETEPEPGRPLVAYGLDSLSAVELRNWIRMKIGVELTTLDITNASSLIALCEKIVSKLTATAA